MTKLLFNTVCSLLRYLSLLLFLSSSLILQFFMSFFFFLLLSFASLRRFPFLCRFWCHRPGPLSEMGPASIMPALGIWLSPLLGVAGARGRQDTCHLHHCQRRLPPSHPCLKVGGCYRERRRKREGFFSCHPLSLSEHAAVALGEDCSCPKGVNASPAFTAQTLSFHSASLLSFPCPLPSLYLPPSLSLFVNLPAVAFRQRARASVAATYAATAAQALARVSREASTKVCTPGYFRLNTSRMPRLW